MSEPILQNSLPHAPWMAARTWKLPGIQPLAEEDWLIRDDAFAAQMAERDRLIAERPDAVHGVLPGAEPAAAELLGKVLAHLRADPAYRVGTDQVTRPDGMAVPLSGPPLLVLGRLVQEDLCLMQAEGGEHVLTGAILCFPSSWTLAQKLGRPLTAIHIPVETYDADIARRVQRLFDAIRVDQPLWRANAFAYDDPTLHQPRREGEFRPAVKKIYVRSERQSLLRLPETGAVVFSIHTWMVPIAALTPEQQAGMATAGMI